MEKLIRRILVPVTLDYKQVPVLKQIAQLAQSHGAELHLLHVGDPADYKPWLWWFHPKVIPLGLTREKLVVLQVLKDMIGREYTVPVHTSVEWGRWRTAVLDHAESIQADLIILNELTVPANKFNLFKSPLEYIIEKSPCQVITLFTMESPAAGWKQVVIPITDFIPEIRLQTILETAVVQKMKIHLITVTSGAVEKRSDDFFYMTETLKRLKPAANLQVECRCLSNSYGPVDSFLHYARSVGADLLMTRMSLQDKKSGFVKDLNFHVA